jgi:hypothetical protein
LNELCSEAVDLLMQMNIRTELVSSAAMAARWNLDRRASGGLDQAALTFAANHASSNKNHVVGYIFQVGCSVVLNPQGLIVRREGLVGWCSVRFEEIAKALLTVLPRRPSAATGLFES